MLLNTARLQCKYIGKVEKCEMCLTENVWYCTTIRENYKERENYKPRLNEFICQTTLKKRFSNYNKFLI